MTQPKSPWPFPTSDHHPPIDEVAAPSRWCPRHRRPAHKVPSSQTDRSHPKIAIGKTNCTDQDSKGTTSAASGGTRSRSGSNYGDWHPDEPPSKRGYDGSARSGDWPEGDKDAADKKEAEQQLIAPTSTSEGTTTHEPSR